MVVVPYVAVYESRVELPLTTSTEVEAVPRTARVVEVALVVVPETAEKEVKERVPAERVVA